MTVGDDYLHKAAQFSVARNESSNAIARLFASGRTSQTQPPMLKLITSRKGKEVRLPPPLATVTSPICTASAPDD
jgi:hypothetical protein